MPCISLNYCHGVKGFIVLPCCKLVRMLDCGPAGRAEWYIFPLFSVGYNLADTWCISGVNTGSTLFPLAANKPSQKMLLLWKACRAFVCQMFKRLCCKYDCFYNSKRKKLSIFELCNESQSGLAFMPVKKLYSTQGVEVIFLLRTEKR